MIDSEKNLDLGEQKTPRAKDRYIEISGTDEYGHSKAHVILSYSERLSDGSTNILQEVNIARKPIISVFRHAGYVNVILDFKSRDDADLAIVWNLLQEYSRPMNSVDWLPEELEAGVYLGEDGQEHPIFFPMLELALSPVQKETEFMLLGMNPIQFTLQPNGPKGEPCALQFSFHEDWFHVTEDLQNKIDLNQLHDEVMQELALDMMEKKPESSEDMD